MGHHFGAVKLGTKNRYPFAVAGIRKISVFNIGEGGSKPADFTVNNPKPSIANLDIKSLQVGNKKNIQLTINGAGFVGSSQVALIIGKSAPQILPRLVVFKDNNFLENPVSNTMIVTGSANDLKAGKIKVINSSPGGGESNLVDFKP